MDKKAIKTFAIESRKKLIEEIKYQASLVGITAEGIANPVEKAEGMEVYDIGASTPNTIYEEAINQRNSLVKRINEKGFDNVVEEVAYTWFNRIIAIRFMEVNDYLPTRVRVLSSATDGKIEPDIVTEVPNVNLDFTDDEIEMIYDMKSENRLDELFRLLFIKQCNKLNEILPELFEKTTDYTELLLSISFTNEEGIVRQLIDTISEDDFTDQVEIIGWLYQYYITELNYLVYDGSYKKDKVPKELIPAATQLFTPDWPVRYMVENSLGRLWLESHPDDITPTNWKYYLEDDQPIPEISEKTDPKSITVFDPCMGSGHILVYAFDLLMDMYKSSGYTERDAAILILENNIYGIDIDDRAYQLAYFSLLMKARKYNGSIFSKYIKLNLCSIKESNNLSLDSLNQIIKDNSIKEDLNYIINLFEDAKEYGSILNINPINFEKLHEYLNKIQGESFDNLYGIVYAESLFDQLYLLIKQAELLSNKYDVVFTNPPYLNSSRFNTKLSDYVKNNYEDTKADLATVLYQKSIKSFSRYNGYISFITTTSWMFLKKFEKFRKDVLENIQFESLVDFGTELFEGKVGHNPIIAWVNKNRHPTNKFTSIKLSEYNYSRRYEKESQFFNESNKFYTNQIKLNEIPGNPLAYWLTDTIYVLFKNEKLSNYAEPRQGLATADNNRFLRLWHEININNCRFNFETLEEAGKSQIKWFPYNKGGSFKKWYGNRDYLVNWHNNGFEIRNFRDKNGKLKSRPQNTKFYFKEGITWSALSSGQISLRYSPPGSIFDTKGPTCFLKNNYDIMFLLGLLNSKVSLMFLEILAPTLDFNPGALTKIPIIYSPNQKIDDLVSDNIKISKSNWDSFEISWDFKSHPFITLKNNSSINDTFNEWQCFTQNQFEQLRTNEEELNEIFINIYGLENELSKHVDDSRITIELANKLRDTKTFISFAVGCMFGRYSLDEEGLVFAGGIWDSTKYTKFIPDNDNIIPILDNEYFDDDIVGRFVEFVKVIFGKDSLEENLDFIAKALKKRGKTSREVIRNYFLTNFYEDHTQTYKKRPIYWLFDSGRNNGFKALIYMHRYEGDLVARVRTDYLHKTQKALETAIAHNDRIIETSTSASEKSKALKAKNKLVKQLEETKKYDEALAHVANQKIEIDLDDGVKVNYAKFQGVEVSSEGQKAKKIDLLKKI